MGTSTIMTYGDYQFSPVPLVTIQRDSIQRPNREDPIGYNFRMTLNGTLTPLPNDGGLAVTDGLIEDLREAFNRDGKRLLVQCGPDGGPYDTIMLIYPRITSITFSESNNNWVRTVPFTIELTYDHDEVNEHPSGEVPPYIEDFSEEWNVEFPYEYHHFSWDLSEVQDQQAGYDYTSYDANAPFEARVTRTVTARGKQSWAGTGITDITGTPTSAADNALDWLLNTFGDFDYDSYEYAHALSGWTNLIGSTGDFCLHDNFRSHVVNETDGSVTLTQSWVVLGANTGMPEDWRGYQEDMSIEIRESLESSYVNVVINGTIHGMQNLDYSTPNNPNPVTTSSYSRATGVWGVIQDRIFPRCQLVYEQEFANTLNPQPLNKSVGHSPGKGTITYSLEFNDRPCAFVTGALTENFTIVDNHPSDVFAKLPVLGRAAGPVLQEISTVTEATREITIEAVMPGPTGCGSITMLDENKPTTNVKNLFCEFETQLTSVYNQVFKNNDVENWNPLSGRYSRTVSYTYQSCSGTPSTSLCD